jgi:hypothetical protein
MKKKELLNDNQSTCGIKSSFNKESQEKIVFKTNHLIVINEDVSMKQNENLDDESISKKNKSFRSRIKIFR